MLGIITIIITIIIIHFTDEETAAQGKWFPKRHRYTKGPGSKRISLSLHAGPLLLNILEELSL